MTGSIKASVLAVIALSAQSATVAEVASEQQTKWDIEKTAAIYEVVNDELYAAAQRLSEQDPKIKPENGVGVGEPWAICNLVHKDKDGVSDKGYRIAIFKDFDILQLSVSVVDGAATTSRRLGWYESRELKEKLRKEVLRQSEEIRKHKAQKPGSEQIKQGRNDTVDNPAKADAAFIVELSSKDNVVIVEKLRSSQSIPWKDIEERVRETSATYKEALVELGNGRRLLVCVFEQKDMDIKMCIYRHYAVFENKITLFDGTRLELSELFKL